MELVHGLAMVEARDAPVRCGIPEEVVGLLKAVREMANSLLIKKQICNFDNIREIVNGVASQLKAFNCTFIIEPFLLASAKKSVDAAVRASLCKDVPAADHSKT